MQLPNLHAHEQIVRDGKGWTVLHWGLTRLDETSQHTPFYVPVKNAPTRPEAIRRLRAWIKHGRSRV